MDVPPGAIAMTHERVLCPRHGEPLRSTWPKGAIIMMVKLFDAVFYRKETLAETRERFGEDVPDVSRIEILLDETPACCRVDATTLMAAYEEAGFGVVAKCVNCRRRRLGAPYRTSTQVAKHLCFACVVHHMKPLH